MISSLKEEWLEKIKIVERRNQFGKYGSFTVMTDFFQAPDEIRNDREMCLKVLLESNEFIWNVPREMLTLDFYEELFEKGYKQNLLEGKSIWHEEFFPFIKKYCASFNGEKVPSFSSWLYAKGIFENREMVLDLVKNNFFKDTKFLIEHYKKDKDIMFEVLRYDPTSIFSMMKSIKNAYCKDMNNVYSMLDISAHLYRGLPEKIKENPLVIDYALSKNGDLLQHIPKHLIENKEYVISLINKNNTIHGGCIPYIYMKDYDIAKLLIKRDGKNFRHFKFKDNKELIFLATETHNDISHIPFTEDYYSLIRNVIKRATADENITAFVFPNVKKAELVKDLFLELYRNKQITAQNIGQYFAYSTKLSEERDLLIECIKEIPSILKHVPDEFKENDYELLNIYINEYTKRNGPQRYFSDLPSSIKNAAIKEGMDVEKYITYKYLEISLNQVEKKKTFKI